MDEYIFNGKIIQICKWEKINKLNISMEMKEKINKNWIYLINELGKTLWINYYNTNSYGRRPSLWKPVFHGLAHLKKKK